MSKQVPYRVRLHIFSPVHIGCDDVYEPTGFMVDKSAKLLFAFDPLDFARTLSAQEKSHFLSICEKGTLESIIELYRFMGKCTPHAEWKSVPVCDGFLAIYNRVLTKLNTRNERDIKQELNNFLIARTSYLPLDQSPYIPGSALKGSLRTGWLNHVQQSRKVAVDTRDRGAAKELEKQLLGGAFDSDPFRFVKVSDLLPVGRPETRICFAVNKKKKPSKYEARGPQQILEVIRHETRSVFEGVITLHGPERGAPIRKECAVPVEKAFFTHSAAFFDHELAAEEALLQGISVPSGVRNAMVLAFGERFMKEVFPVRIGRHSGAECVTVAGVRNIRIMGKKGDPPKSAGNSTTVWLAGDSSKAENNLHPFGWAALEILPLDSANPYPERIFNDRPPAPAEAANTKEQKPEQPPAVIEKIVWDKAVLTWSPGNVTLTASFEGKKTEIKLSADRSIVPEQLHKKLFDKKTAVPARVTLEKDGNLLKIVKIESV